MPIQPRRGSRILQGRVSNPSERGIEGRGGYAPSPENFCITYIKMFYAFPQIFIDAVTANRYGRKLTFAFKLQNSNMF